MGPMFFLFSALFLVPVVLAALILLAAALGDVRRFKISNRLSLALAALFLLYAFLAPVPFWPHVIVGLLVLGVGFGFFALGLLGGGDVKLLAAAALWAGPEFALTLLLATTGCGGLLAGAYALYAWQRQRRCKKNPESQQGEPEIAWQKTPVPYGMAIACGGWMVLFFLVRGSLT